MNTFLAVFATAITATALYGLAHASSEPKGKVVVAHPGKVIVNVVDDWKGRIEVTVDGILVASESGSAFDPIRWKNDEALELWDVLAEAARINRKVEIGSRGALIKISEEEIYPHRELLERLWSLHKENRELRGGVSEVSLTSAEFYAGLAAPDEIPEDPKGHLLEVNPTKVDMVLRDEIINRLEFRINGKLVVEYACPSLRSYDYCQEQMRNYWEILNKARELNSKVRIGVITGHLPYADGAVVLTHEEIYPHANLLERIAELSKENAELKADKR